MEWISNLFLEQSALQAIIVIALISAIGLALGKIHVMGVSLGVTFVFFAGILAGHFGLSIHPEMLNYAESFGLVLFVYALGLQVGPGFFSSFHKGGVRLNMLALAVVLAGTAMAIAFHYASGVSMPDMAGMALPALSESEVLELQKKEFGEAVDPIRPILAKAGLTPKEVCLVGNPGDEIAAFAKKKKLDLVVMGSHGYGRFKSAVMGSTATRIAAQGDVPILLIRR